MVKLYQRKPIGVLPYEAVIANPTDVLEVAVEAITQNLNSFIEGE